MPELPEVETERRYLNAGARHRRVVGVRAPHPDVLLDTSAVALGRRLKGHRIESTRRHGKYLFAGFDNGAWLAMHFGMTGTLRCYRHDLPVPDYAAVLFLLEDGRDLAYLSRRRLGRISLVDSPDELIAQRRLGPDALSIGSIAFCDLITGGRGAVKARLMDQARIAGIGNEYSDEILFRAGVHPARPVTGLSKEEVGRLHRSMRAVLRKAIALRADPEKYPASWLMANRRRNGSCPVCGGAISTTTVSGRTGYFCPRCQPRHGKRDNRA